MDLLERPQPFGQGRGIVGAEIVTALVPVKVSGGQFGELAFENGKEPGSRYGAESERKPVGVPRPGFLPCRHEAAQDPPSIGQARNDRGDHQTDIEARLGQGPNSSEASVGQRCLGLEPPDQLGVE